MVKKIHIHFFSGTGNSLAATDNLEKEFTRKGCEVEKTNIEKQDISVPGLADLELFVFPVIAFSVPAIVSTYFRKFQQVKKVPAVVIITAGGWPGRALIQAEGELKSRGFDVLRTGFLSYPDNWTQFTNPMEKEQASKVISTAEKEIPGLVVNIMSDRRKLFRINAFDMFWSSIVGWLFLNIGRYIMGMCYVADKNCNECGICVRTCPTRNIGFKRIFSKKLLWGYDCVDCNRCINICPRKAIQVSWFALMLHGIYEVSAVTILIKIFAHSAPGSGLMASGGTAMVVQGGLFLLGLALIVVVELTVLNWILFILHQIPFVRKFSSWSWTNRSRRYLAPGFNPARK